MNRKYRKTVIAGNWKMNKTPSETKEFMTEFKSIMPKGRWCDVALCVPAVCIPAKPCTIVSQLPLMEVICRPSSVSWL